MPQSWLGLGLEGGAGGLPMRPLPPPCLYALGAWREGHRDHANVRGAVLIDTSTCHSCPPRVGLYGCVPHGNGGQSLQAVA